MTVDKPRTNRNLSRRRNRYLIIEFLRRTEEASPSLISSELEISLPTVGRVLEDLVEEGLVEHIGRETASIGRPAGRVRFMAENYAIVAVYAHVSGIIGVASDLKGETLARREALVVDDGERNIATLVELIRSLQADVLSRVRSLRGIGVGVSSMVRQPDGLVVLTSGLGWRSVPLRQRLAAIFEEPVFIDSDRNLGAVGEWAYGSCRHVDHLVRLSVGPGASAGFVVDGEVYRGVSDAAGELKWFLDDPRLGGHHLPLLGDRQSLRFGKGIPQAAFVALEEVAQDYTAGRIALDAFDSVFETDQRLELVRQLLDYTTMAAAHVSAMLNPNVVVLTGAITRGGAFVVDLLQYRLGGDVYNVPKIVLSKLDRDAVMLGAVKMVLDATTLQPDV